MSSQASNITSASAQGRRRSGSGRGGLLDLLRQLGQDQPWLADDCVVGRDVHASAGNVIAGDAGRIVRSAAPARGRGSGRGYPCRLLLVPTGWPRAARLLGAGGTRAGGLLAYRQRT